MCIRLLRIVLGQYTDLLFKHTKKACVIIKARFHACFCHVCAILQQLLSEGDAFIHNVLVNSAACMLFKQTT
ncbi:hypothetical protein D3C86_2052870 [compost metagenome]